jgi:hypothetical protein
LSLCQYLYFCTSKEKQTEYLWSRRSRCWLSLCQYLYFCTSKESKVSIYGAEGAGVGRVCVSICTFVLVKKAN